MFHVHRSLAAFIALFVAVTMPVYAAPVTEKQQVIMGWIEHVDVPELTGALKAKLDTGATTSSIRAEVLKVIEPEEGDEDKKNKGSVVFKLTDSDGKVTTMQRKLVRWVRIKKKEGDHQRRPVVEMAFCVAGRLIREEVNLAPREDFIYPILIGRNMLNQGRIIVDSSRSFTAKAHCTDPEEQKALTEED